MKRITLILALLLIALTPTIAQEKGTNFETTCDDRGICTTQVYSYEKYFQQNERWQEIDETFRICDEGICTNNHRGNIIINNGQIVTRDGERTTTTRPTGDFANDAVYEPNIEGNTLTYKNVRPGVDIQYTYLPHMLKEDIILNERPRTNGEERFYIINFQISGEPTFAPFIACDANEHCIEFRTRRTREGLQLRVPMSFLTDERTQYPVKIDPSVMFDNAAVLWNGHIRNTTYPNGTSYYDRFSGVNLLVGWGPYAPVGGDRWNRGAIDWDVSSIPDDAVIYNISLELYAYRGPGGPTAFSFTIEDVENASTTYINNNSECSGNCQYVSDINNGAEYFTTVFATRGLYNMSLNTTALTDLEQALPSDTFSVGFSSGTRDVLVRGVSHKNSSQRPKMHVTWGAPAFNASVAMDAGINAELSSTIHNNQQVYVVDTAGTHHLETVDKFIKENNQAWVFNYVLPGESFLNVPSLFTVLNSWEDTALTQQEIEDSVSDFINGTVN